MRCPNCGNENPDDYTFCDECGAKLTPPGSDPAMPTMTAPASTPGPAGGASGNPSAVPEATYASTTPGGDGAAGTALDANASAMPGPGPASGVDTAAKPAGGVCPNCGAAIVPGEAYCNECGAELATAAAPVGDGAPDSAQPYMGSMADNEEEGGVSVGVPVTEDTMTPAALAQSPDAPQAEAAQATSMPGVRPIEDTQEASVAVPPAMEETAPESTLAPQPMQASTAAWATDALRQLEEAQQSMAKGDWVAYGQSMSALKAFLENVVKGTAPQVAGINVASAPMPHQPVVDEATAAEARSAGTSAPVGPAPVPATPSAPAASAYQGTSTAAGLARLVVIATGAELPLPQQEEITVGREDPSSGIFPDIDLTPYGGEDGGVSRRHARLLHIGNDYFVEDLQSTNYTKLDGQRLPARVREKLEDGARLDFGRVAMIFRKA